MIMKNKNIVSVLPAIILLIGGLLLMQIHSMEFWTEHTGSAGYLWSLMIEGAAVWLWASSSKSKALLAMIASVLALAGPLYQVATPILDDLQSSQKEIVVSVEQKQSLKDEIITLESALNTYLSNSESRVGWAQRIDSTTNQLVQSRKDLHSLYQAETEVKPQPWQAIALVAMQALALIVIQLTLVMAIRSLRVFNSKNSAPADSGARAERSQSRAFKHPKGATKTQGLAVAV